MIHSMVMEKRAGITARLSILGCFIKARKMEKADLNGMMVVFMMETLLMEFSKVMVSLKIIINNHIGKYYFADHDKWYEGEFRMGNIEGRGTESWSDGRKYDGDFKNGKKDGEGTFIWPNGNKYIGSWRDDK